ncbi:G-type lectin S-receptor-like serine threonine-kinase LECRK3 [Olea europaea subsp. europaea]|uniref:non-specific serine/threonine protein kinase n=1 Tax=Olea europaea subsp. europaea TaxID=158383 RepID=A0A8S0RIW4_OLEEU|nr:G-type lectin S-receptor-like serine threonine-kinase LECRK3 [Olea europaea subsp. europaea]
MRSLFSMAVLPCFLILSALMASSAQRQRYSNINPGTSLHPRTNSSWLSPSGLYAFGFYKLNNGYAVGIFLAGILEKTVVWTANRDDPVFPSTAILVLTSDGRLILQLEDREDINIVYPGQSVASASMLDSGNFVLYDSSRRIAWQSFDHPTDTLLPNQSLSAGEEIFSSVSERNPARGIFRLKMQNDGKLVQYPVETPDTAPYAYYASYGDGGNNVSLNLDIIGNLYMFNGSSVIKSLNVGLYRTRTIYRMRIDVDGIVRLYYRSLDPQGKWTKQWSTTEDKCAPKGLCGLNGYCILMDEDAVCNCLPGFDQVNPSNWSSGCQRSLSMEGCKANDQNVSYEIIPLDNTMWEDVNYAVLKGMTIDECKKACLDDCNCDAALFLEGGDCRKQRLPLRYGRRSPSNSSVALIKVSKSTPSSTEGVLGNSGKEIRLDILIVSISLVALAALILAFSGIYVHRNRVGRYKILKLGNVELIEDVGLREFTYEELVQATNEFKEELGRGASATVYKGILSNNRNVVAVKRLEKELVGGEKEFQTEMKVIGKTYHRNLVRLLGYCLEGSKWLLVYEYMKNGTLADILFNPETNYIGKKEFELLSILQEASSICMMSLLKKDQTNTYTVIRGTRGYVALEWHKKLPVTVKADVYNFGIVLLEIICGRKSVDWSLSEDEAILDEWVYQCLQEGETSKLVRYEDVDKRKFERMIKIEKTVVWTVNRDDPIFSSTAILVLTSDGRLILQQEDREDINIVYPGQSVASTSMLDSGNFVLYDSSRRIAWQSFDHPTDTLLPNQSLSAGEEIFSSVSKTNPARGIFRLKMQNDGNLVQYPVETPDTAPYAYYPSYGDGGNNVSLNLDIIGNLYMFNGSSVIKSLNVGLYRTRTIYRMRIDVDGIVRLYYRSLDPQGKWTKQWSTTEDKCAPKGLCGLNGYCILMDEDAVCNCLPGFDQVNPSSWSSGCQRSLSMEGCKAKDQNVSYEIIPLDNIMWEDVNYVVLKGMTIDECKKAYLDDCNCDAALFLEGGDCRKQRLPLRYGRRSPSNSGVALIKVSKSTPSSTEGVLGNSGKEIRLDILIVSISLVALAALILAFTGIYVHRNRVGRYKKIFKLGNVELMEDVGLREFTYQELVQATNEFKEELGRGASATVYKGILSNNGNVVAVKRLEKELVEGEIKFQTEMKVIGKIYHRNLVRLLGYCLEGSKWLLVYEYMKNGTLANILFNPENRLYWEERIRIALDIARGILYLHEECETQIIHCDIKPQNILMDEHRCAKISDFGLAKLLKKDQTNTYTVIRETRGYIAPEWHKKLPVTVKADVYSFGIVLLEIICGRKSVDWSLSEDEAILDEWVYQCLQEGGTSKLV